MDAINAYEVAAAAGIGVTVVKEKSANSTLRLPGPEEGIPPLPDTEIVLNRTVGTESKVAQLLAEYIILEFEAEDPKPLRD